MDITLRQVDFAERIEAPSSKSAAHRPMIAAAFADRPTRIALSGAGEDIAATAACLSAIGVGVKELPGALEITPPARFSQNAVADCGESGSTLRFLVPVAGALGLTVKFLRRGRLPERPMEPLASELARHGVTLCDCADGGLLVSGKLCAGEYRIAANVSSQFITGLLFALSLLPEPSVLTLVGEIESAPYIDMTLETLATFGAAPEKRPGQNVFDIAGRSRKPFRSPRELRTEGDYSGAAFPLAAGAVGAHPVTVCNLRGDSAQGDREILALLSAFGAEVTVKQDSVTVSPAPLRGIDINAKQIPDLVPVLAIVACAAKGDTRITGAARLRIKESDRIATTLAMIRALGGKAEELEDGLVIHGGTALTGGTVSGAGDHRIVMSAAVAALCCSGPVTILGAEAVKKSYPLFFEDAINRGKEPS